MKAIRINETGGRDKLSYEDVPQPEPKAGEALVKIEAAGVNFIDVYQRTGQYKMQLPFTLGQEAAGVVEAVGDGVSEVQPGDRVAYANIIGAYAEYAVVPAHKLVPVPEGIDSRTAAAVLLQGMTAHYLAYSTFPLESGHQALVHAAAGGVGLLLVQLAKQRGAYVIGTVSTEEKAELARGAGADAIIRYDQQEIVPEVKRLVGDQGVHVAYDSVGKATFNASLDCLRKRGYLVLFGQSSGAVPPVDPQILNAKGSLFLTRPTLGHYVTDRDELLWRARDLFGAIKAGSLNVRIDRAVPLSEVAEAHRALESRETSGKVLVLP